MDEYIKKNVLYLINNDGNIIYLTKYNKQAKIYEIENKNINQFESQDDLIKNMINVIDKIKSNKLRKIKNKKKYFKLLDNKFNKLNTTIYKNDKESLIFMFTQNQYYNGKNNYFDIYVYKYITFGFYVRRLDLIHELISHVI